MNALFEINESPTTLRKPPVVDMKKFDTIVEHISNNKRIKLNVLKEKNVNVNDLVKFAQIMLHSYVSNVDALDEVLDPQKVNEASIAEQIRFWEMMNEDEDKHLDDLLAIAFIKHRSSGTMKQETSHLTKFVKDNPQHIQSLRITWKDQHYLPYIFEKMYALTCWFKFDNRDRNTLFEHTPRKTSMVKDFDYDARHGVFKNVLERNEKEASISFYAYFSFLQFLLRYEQSCHEDINTLIRNNVIHYCELTLIRDINKHV